MISEPFRFTTHYLRVDTKKFGQPIYLFPPGDEHVNCQFHDKSAFRRFLTTRKDQLDGGDMCVFLKMGDEVEGMSRRERQAIVEGSFHDETYIKKSLESEREIKQFVDDTAFMTTHPNATLIGGVEGNHRGVIRRETDETWRNFGDYMFGLYQQITPKGKHKPINLGGDTMIRLAIDSGGRRMFVDICAVHGQNIGGGRTRGGSINAIINKLGGKADANIYLAGHNHDLQVAGGDQLKLRSVGRNAALTSRCVRFVRTGSYRLGYVPGISSYVAAASYPLAMIGTPEIVLTPQKSNGNVRVDIKVNSI